MLNYNEYKSDEHSILSDYTVHSIETKNTL